MRCSRERPANPSSSARVGYARVAAWACAALLGASESAAQALPPHPNLLDDDLVDWPADALSAAGVGAFEHAAERLERAAAQLTGEDAARRWESAARVRFALDDERAARRDVTAALSLVAEAPAAATSAWAAVELLGARCEARTGEAEREAREAAWRRCELVYRQALLRFGDRPPPDVSIRARAAIARTLWEVGDDGGARREARAAIDAWRSATDDPTEDVHVDGPSPVETGRASRLREIERWGRAIAEIDRCVESPPPTRPFLSRHLARDDCWRRMGPRLERQFDLSGRAAAAATPPRPGPARNVARASEARATFPRDGAERARDAIAALRFDFARRTYPLWAAEIEEGMVWPQANPPIRGDDVRDSIRISAIALPLYQLLAQVEAVIATGSPRWRFRALALRARAYGDIQDDWNRYWREHPPQNSWPDQGGGGGGSPSDVALRDAAMCRDEAFAARDLDAASTCERQLVRFRAHHRREEIVPPLLSR